MTTPKRKAFSDQSRWQISKGIWWFAVPPATQPTNAHAFYTLRGGGRLLRRQRPTDWTRRMRGLRIGVWEDGSPQWHEARRLRLGGSEIGTAMGWNQWERRDELLYRKLGLLAPRETNAAMERGHYLEAAVADWLADKQRFTYDDDASQGTYVHPDIPWALFNPDRITTTGELVEIKTAREKDPEHGWGRQGTDQIPLTYAAQVTWGMHVLGLTVCHIGVLFGAPFQFARYKVRYDPEVADHLVTEGERFIADLIHTETRNVA